MPGWEGAGLALRVRGHQPRAALVTWVGAPALQGCLENCCVCVRDSPEQGWVFKEIIADKACHSGWAQSQHPFASEPSCHAALSDLRPRGGHVGEGKGLSPAAECDLFISHIPGKAGSFPAPPGGVWCVPGASLPAGLARGRRAGFLSHQTCSVAAPQSSLLSVCQELMVALL